MENNNVHLMTDFNEQLDEIRSVLYKLLEFEADEYSQKKDLAKREVMFSINELRISVENI